MPTLQQAESSDTELSIEAFDMSPASLAHI